jgi:hypothetical protein
MLLWLLVLHLVNRVRSILVMLGLLGGYVGGRSLGNNYSGRSGHAASYVSGAALTSHVCYNLGELFMLVAVITSFEVTDGRLEIRFEAPNDLSWFPLSRDLVNYSLLYNFEGIPVFFGCFNSLRDDEEHDAACRNIFASSKSVDLVG